MNVNTYEHDGIRYAEYRGRGAGRTYELVRHVPDGGIFIVSNGAMRDHVRHILAAQGREPDALKIEVVGHPDRLRGRNRSTIGIDHHVWENASERQCAELRVVMAHLHD